MDTDIRDIDGLTPADLAEECKHTDCADFLKSPLQVNTCFNISYRYKEPVYQYSADMEGTNLVM